MIVQVYTKPQCPYCDQAKALLNQKGIKFEQIELNYGQEGTGLLEVTEFKIMFPGVSTVPLVLIDGHRFTFTQLRQYLNERSS